MGELLATYIKLIEQEGKPFLYEEYASWLEGVVAEKDARISTLEAELERVNKHHDDIVGNIVRIIEERNKEIVSLGEYIDALTNAKIEAETKWSELEQEIATLKEELAHVKDTLGYRSKY
jgi:chromosome segregation ATPase